MTPFQRHIKRAIEICGNQKALAEASGLAQQTISRLLTTQQKIKLENAIAIEFATGGKVTRGDLRPDLYGEARPRKKRKLKREQERLSDNV